MFTGIIEYAGQVLSLHRNDGGARLVLKAGPLADTVKLGDSVAVNGVCLTVVSFEAGELAFDAVNETLARSSLGELTVGRRVNLERPMRADGRFDGHIVQGHVDGTGEVLSIVDEGDSRRVRVEPPSELLRYIVEKGSITVDGISLTVAALGDTWFEVVIIPHTWEVTNLSDRSPGDRVNLEADVLAKYVERMLSARA